MIFFVLLEKIKFYPENIILFFRRKIVDGLTEKIHGNNIVCIFHKDGISFCYKYDITFPSKKQR